LLSKVKSTPFSEEEIIIANSFLETMEKSINLWEKERPLIKCKEFEGRDHWFQKNVSEELTYLLNCIDTIENENVKNFFKIVFSSNIVKVSNQESDTRFAAKNKNIVNNYTLNFFLKKGREYLKRIKDFSTLADFNSVSQIVNADSRYLDFIPNESVDLIITSPPYANTYDYYLYHKFRKKWLDIDVKYAQNNEIGSRREYSSLKKSPSQWSEDLKLCFKEMYRTLKFNGHAFIVIGDSVINKELIKVDEIIREFIPDVGFICKNIISTPLSNHSRMFNPSFTQKNKKEHLIILQK
jgi:site-specific DNA-methyltransferase (cytosine-N4-specific)